MNISLTHAAEILSITEDEVMFLNQQNKLPAAVDQTTMKWQFDITEVLELKKKLDEETKDTLTEGQ